MRLLFNMAYNMYPNLLKSLTWRCRKLKIFLNAGSLLAAHQCLKDGRVFISNAVFCVGAPGLGTCFISKSAGCRPFLLPNMTLPSDLKTLVLKHC